MRVVVKNIKNRKIVKEIITSSRRKAEKVLNGLRINLDHDRYFAIIEEN